MGKMAMGEFPSARSVYNRHSFFKQSKMPVEIVTTGSLGVPRRYMGKSRSFSFDSISTMCSMVLGELIWLTSQWRELLLKTHRPSGSSLTFRRRYLQDLRNGTIIKHNNHLLVSNSSMLTCCSVRAFHQVKLLLLIAEIRCSQQAQFRHCGIKQDRPVNLK